ncbi:MAG: response regulator transcription factor [Gammaproteobacteria bacterium]|nr:response regulator transcription factor [Gammaproteobacteria bacterium]MBU1654140.1 response regulator transcription factor [Gammaproteobacteria bacterium]MBU1960334.1 response regulator transcription factor [Gammaproteobacteria bacterium]
MRVLLIDDHALFRMGLRELLERREIEVVDAVGDGEEGIALVARHQPDVVLLDMRMPGMGGLDVLRRLRADHPRMPIVMLTTSREERDVIDSLQQGAQGYLLKDMEPAELIDALNRIVGKGETVVAGELTAVLARAVQGGEKEAAEPMGDALFAELTPREREILCHLAEGQSNKVIARNLGISDGTVKLHVKAILRKLNVHSRVEAAVIAVERNQCGRPGEPGRWIDD